MSWNPDINNFICVGRVCNDAKISKVDDKDVLNFSIACKSIKPETTDFFAISVWGKYADTLSQFIAKGKQVVVQGRIQNIQYTTKDGVKKEKVNVNADKVQIVSYNTENKKYDNEQNIF